MLQILRTLAVISLVIFSVPALCEDKSKSKSDFDGKIITSIEVEIRKIFDEPDLNIAYQTANNLKVQTQTKVILRELLFKEGEPYDTFTIKESERQLREQKFLTNVKITPVKDNDGVKVKVIVQDTWTIIPQASFSNGGGTSKRAIGLSESNLFGYGKRFDILLRENDTRRDTEFFWDDQRFLGSKNRLTAAVFDRGDGHRYSASIGNPFRSVLNKSSWSVSGENSDILGKLYKLGDERYLFRKATNEYKARYTFAPVRGEDLTRRFSVGLNYRESDFSQATLSDYRTLDLNPKNVSNDINLLPEDRRMSGLILGYESIVTDFLSSAYIDRFERVEDFNIGDNFVIDTLLAPTALGSLDDSLEVYVNRSFGEKFNLGSFIRFDGGVSSRYRDGSLENSVIRAEVRYYDVMGDLFLGWLFLGKHTFASTLYADYGHKLDLDREFLIGSSNGLRGYTAKAFSGDKRAALVVEDRIHLADDVLKLFSFGGVAFIDVGGASKRSFGEVIGDEIYSDFGFGFRLGFPRSSGGGVVRFDVAFPMRDSLDGSNAMEPRFVASIGQVFGGPNRSDTVTSNKVNPYVGIEND